MMGKPMKTLELHYLIIKILMKAYTAVRRAQNQNAHAYLANLPATPARAARKLSLSAPGPSAKNKRENRSTEIFHLPIT